MSGLWATTRDPRSPWELRGGRKPARPGDSPTRGWDPAPPAPPSWVFGVLQAQALWDPGPPPLAPSCSPHGGAGSGFGCDTEPRPRRAGLVLPRQAASPGPGSRRGAVGAAGLGPCPPLLEPRGHVRGTRRHPLGCTHPWDPLLGDPTPPAGTTDPLASCPLAGVPVGRTAVAAMPGCGTPQCQPWGQRG